MDKDGLKNIPFYIWECLVISPKTKDINLVIRDPVDMDRILKYLTYRLKTNDGQRDTAVGLLTKMNDKSISEWR